MTFGSTASRDGTTFSIFSQSRPVFSVFEDEEGLGEEEGGDEGPASGCAALLGIEGTLYFGVPRTGVGPT
jgi:hypothetical protein